MTATNQPLTLLSLPGEIHNIIFNYVLTSRTGRIKLSVINSTPRRIKLEETSDDSSISPALLRVCKKFNTDCKDIIWTNNIIVLFAETCLYLKQHQISPVHKGLVTKPFALIRDLEMHFDPFFQGGSSWGVLDGLGQWAQRGALKSLTLQCLYSGAPKVPIFRNFHPPLDGPNAGKMLYVSTLWLREANNKHGEALQRVQKRIVLTARLEEYILEAFYQTYTFDVVVKQLHGAFGGELWVGDECRWKDGKQVALSATL